MFLIGLFGGNKTMIAYNGFLDDDDATKEAGTDFARRGDSAPRNSNDDDIQSEGYVSFS